MNASDWIAVVATVISLGALALAWVSLQHAREAERRSLADARTQAFITFRSRFLQIKHELPPGWDDDRWLPQPNSRDWGQIESYWQNAFDEWFVPTRLNKEYLEELWTVFFESAVKSALDYRALRHVVWRLCENGEFGKYTDEFREVLEQLGRRPLDGT